jgi:hypothetical protein
MARRGVSQDDVTSFLEANAARNDSREIQDAVRNAFAQIEVGGAVAPAQSPGLTMRPPVRVKPFPVVDLWESSPLRLDDVEHPKDVVGMLFPADALLCVGLDRYHYKTGPLRELEPILPRAEFIVPNQAAARSGHTQAGKPSSRCKEMFPVRRYVVIELDPPATDDPERKSHYFDVQSSILHHLAHRAPLAMVVHSGGKSLHGWFTASRRERDNEGLIDYAVLLGADPAARNRCQGFRLPLGVRRPSGPRQEVLYFNPRALP